MDLSTLLFVCPLFFLAGLVDGIGGGGGLISLPTYLLAGLPPHLAIGTSKLASCMGKAASICKFAKSGFVDWKLAPVPVIVSFVGSYVGASIALAIAQQTFEIVLLVLLPIVAFFVLRKQNTDAAHVDMPYRKRVGILSSCAFVCNAYDGFYGPGSGTFLLLSFAKFAGLDIREAAAQTKVVNIAGAGMALVTFALAGQVAWLLGITAGLFSFFGSYVGSMLVVNNGAKIVRPIILIVLAALFIKTLWQYLPLA